MNTQTKEKPKCQRCDDTGYEDVYGDTEGFEWDIIGYKPCRNGCLEDLE